VPLGISCPFNLRLDQRRYARALLACYFRSGNCRLRKATLEPPLRYLKQQESSNARHLIAQAIIDCAHKGIREPDEKRPCTYEDPDRLKSEGSMTPEANISALCHEFTNALTEILAERRGRIARTHAAVKRHPEYNEHALCVAVETAFMRWEALQNNAPSDTAGALAINPR
jgi:hypothetical protein